MRARSVQCLLSGQFSRRFRGAWSRASIREDTIVASLKAHSTKTLPFFLPETSYRLPADSLDQAWTGPLVTALLAHFDRFDKRHRCGFA